MERPTPESARPGSQGLDLTIALRWIPCWEQSPCNKYNKVSGILHLGWGRLRAQGASHFHPHLARDMSLCPAGVSLEMGFNPESDFSCRSALSPLPGPPLPAPSSRLPAPGPRPPGPRSWLPAPSSGLPAPGRPLLGAGSLVQAGAFRQPLTNPVLTSSRQHLQSANGEGANGEEEVPGDGGR